MSSTGSATRIAGTNSSGYADGTGTAATFYFPYHLAWALESSEVLYIADRRNHRIRKMVLSTAVVSTLAGSGTSGYLEGACASARFQQPRGVAASPTGAVYVFDSDNHSIRKIQ